MSNQTFIIPMFMKVTAKSAEACDDKILALQGVAMKAGFSLHEDDGLPRTPVDDDEITSILDVIELSPSVKPHQTAMGKVIDKVIAQCGDESVLYPRETWQCRVEYGDTRLGYWEWVIHAAESDDRSLDQLVAIESELAQILVRLNQHGKPVKETAMGFELDRGIYLCRYLDMLHLQPYVTKSADGFLISDAGRRHIHQLSKREAG